MKTYRNLTFTSRLSNILAMYETGQLQYKSLQYLKQQIQQIVPFFKVIFSE